MRSTLLLAGALLSSTVLAAPQGPNTVAANNPTLATQAQNGTFFLVPINSSAVAKAAGYPLLPLPTDLFPHGFPEGTHPVIVSNRYSSDIRTLDSTLQIPYTMLGSVYIPFLDRLGDGKTPFQLPMINVVGTDQPLNSLVPSLVGSLGGYEVAPGAFYPNTAAYLEIAPGQYIAEGKYQIVPNSVSGPSVEPSIYDFLFSTASSSEALYTQHTFHAMLNQPLILSTGMCARQALLFNESFADPKLRTGKVTLYPTTLPQGFGGEYEGVGGFSAQGETIANNPQDCKTAAADVDPSLTN